MCLIAQWHGDSEQRGLTTYTAEETASTMEKLAAFCQCMKRAHPGFGRVQAGSFGLDRRPSGPFTPFAMVQPRERPRRPAAAQRRSLRQVAKGAFSMLVVTIICCLIWQLTLSGKSRSGAVSSVIRLGKMLRSPGDSSSSSSPTSATGEHAFLSSPYHS